MFITPGPNNAMITISGLKFGFKKTLPHLTGIALGHALQISLVCAGLGFILINNPEIQIFLKWACFFYLLFLSYKMLGSFKDYNKESGKPLRAYEAALFQWINPKGVFMALSGLTTYNITNYQGAFIYFLVLPFCVGIWLILGEQLENSLEKNKRVARAAYVVLGVSMIASLLLA